MFEDFTSTREKQCKLVQRAIDRYFEMLARAKEKRDIYFDEQAALAAISNFRFFKHYKGEFRGLPFALLPFQKFIVGNIFGWKYRKNSLRLFRTVYIEIPRKNGKTALAGGIALNGFLFDKEGGVEVYTVATKEEQAKLSWNDCCKFIRSNPVIAAKTKIRVKHVEFPHYDGVLKPLGSDSETLDGLNPHFVIADELHAWKDRGLWDVMEDGMGARSQPMMVAITTAGYNQNGVCFTLRKHVVNILNKVVSDESTFGMIFTIDDGDDYFLPEVWEKANPALGSAKRLDYMHRQAAAAMNMPEKLNTFLNKQLDVWTTAAAVWIDVAKWNALKVEPDDLATPLLPSKKLSGLKCVAALDMSRTTDLTALTLFFPKQEGIETNFAVPFFFIPAENARIKEKEDGVSYIAWERQGYVRFVESEYVHDTDVETLFAELMKIYNIVCLVRDRWGTKLLSERIEKLGAHVEDYGQGFKDMSRGCKSLEEMILAGEIRHFGNPCLAWNISNVVTEMDAAENIKFSKKKSYGRIDGAVALAMCCGRAKSAPLEISAPSFSII